MTTTTKNGIQQELLALPGPDTSGGATEPPPVKVTLTTFVDFVIATGTSRVKLVRKAKAQYGTPYDPGRDHWGALRRAIADTHKRGFPAEALDRVVSDQKRQSKRASYERTVDAYKKWAAGKALDWIGQQKGTWTFGRLAVTVNPELGVRLGSTGFNVKLYFKAEELSRRRVETILHLMAIATQVTGANRTPALMDVPRGRFLPQDAVLPDMNILLNGESAGFLQIWDLV